MDKRKVVREVIPKKYKIVPGKYYMSYSVKEKTKLGEAPVYEIIARYFMYTGNILADSKFLRTENFLFYSDAILQEMVANIEKSLSKTKDRMRKELEHIGASPRNILNIMKQRGF